MACSTSVPLLEKPSVPRSSGLLLILALGTFAGADAALAQSPPSETTHVLTESRAVELALARPAINDIIEGRVNSARSEVVQVSIWPNPSFEYTRETIGDGPGESTEQFFSLSQRFDLSGRRALRRNAAERHLGATQAKTQARQLDVVAETRRRFFEVLHRQQRVEAFAEWSEHLAGLEAVITRRKALGEASGYDLSRLLRERTSATAQTQSQRAALDRARERLNAQLGDAPVPAYQRVSGELLPDQPEPVQALLAAVGGRPELLYLERQAEAFTLDQKAAGRWGVPEFDLALGVKTLEINGRTESGLLLSAAVPLPLFDRRQAEGSQARAQAQIARGEYQLALSWTRGEISALWKELQRLRLAARDFRVQGLDAAQKLVRIANAAYQGGEIGVFELLDAYGGALEATTQTLDLDIKARNRAIELDRLTGRGTR